MEEMASAEDYTDDVKYVVKVARAILWIVGAWPIPATSPRSKRIKLRAQNVVVYFFFVFTIMPGLLRMFLIEKTMLKKVMIMGPVLNCSMQFFKYTILLYHSEEIRRIIAAIGQDWTSANQVEREILRSKAKVGRRVALMSAMTIYFSGFGYRTFIPLSKGTVVTAENVTIRPLAFPVSFIFFNEQISPIYEIVFGLQFVAGFLTYSVISGSCGMCALLILHVCSQLAILVNKINRIADGENIDDAVLQRRIVDIVEHQTKIKGFLAEVQTITEYICLVEIVGATFLICIVGYYVLMELGNFGAMLVYIVLMYAITFSVFMLCYIGQLLDNENSNVGQATITVDWYRFPAKKARYLVLIIAISNYPMKLTAGKMVDMSLATFTDIMKVSMGYLNMLRAVI
ncbi:odorant receptor 4-like [Andrena cerasifolii]|uniref:odorant receptor 4-like n=1 Tax=Andrena cerasifolii TaxID=2819439 RepID=UPI0040382723